MDGSQSFEGQVGGRRLEVLERVASIECPMRYTACVIRLRDESMADESMANVSLISASGMQVYRYGVQEEEIVSSSDLSSSYCSLDNP